MMIKVEPFFECAKEVHHFGECKGKGTIAETLQYLH